jgi:DNA-binding response OmpR family regulator
MTTQRHILVVEGCSALRRLVCEVLTVGGLTKFTQVGTHKEALSVLRACKVDLLIIAHRINGISRLDPIGLIRAGDAGCKKKLPIIVLGSPTANEDGADSWALVASTTTFVALPFHMRTLLPPVFDALRGAAERSERNVTLAGLARLLMVKTGRILAPAELG